LGENAIDTWPGGALHGGASDYPESLDFASFSDAFFGFMRTKRGHYVGD